ncbi:MAG: N-6 DNA methylase [Chloroflexi bacterium]|nr:N-6 DNA methylase [Chloroflexota bacterium]
MAKLKRSELRAQLLRSVQILKSSLSYSSYCYLILAMLFFNHVVESPLRYGTPAPGQIPATLPHSTPNLLHRRKKKDREEEEWHHALANLEDYFTPLKEVLTPALKRGQPPENALTEIQLQFDKLQQTTGVFSNPDSFSYAFEYWIEQLALLTVKRGVSFYTQPSLIRLMIELLKPRAGLSIYDPSVGTGGTLVEAAHYVEQQGGSPATLRLFGREKAADIWAICKMNMLAHGLDNAVIVQGDTLQGASASTNTFDLVLQELPLAPNRRSGQLADAAFLRHAVQSLTPDGRAAILCPSAVAQHDHPEFWRFVLSRDWLEAVISLPPRLLQGTPSGACLFVFNRQKPTERLAHVLFMQAAPNLAPRSRYNQLPDEAIQAVVQMYERWNDDSTDARIVPVQQIEEQNYRLNVDRYLDWVEMPKSFNVNVALSRYRTAVQKRDEAVDGLMKALERLNYAVGESKGSTPNDGIASP